MSTIWNVLKAPVVTEKALDMKDDSVEDIRDSKNKKTIKRDRQVLAFRVANGASKHAIKEAVETIFKVKVDEVRVINYTGQNGPPWPHVRTQTRLTERLTSR